MKKIRFSANFHATDAGGNSVIQFAAGQEYPADDPEALRCIARGIAEEVDVPDEQPAGPTRTDLDAALQALPDGNTDPDYVVGAMRTFFGDLFTDDDEALVRDLVKPPAAPAPAPAPSAAEEPAQAVDVVSETPAEPTAAPAPAPAGRGKRQ
ncbi:hypothetical protein J2W35_003297 [Variovorax boronicumulans]|uniref:hypothetical protein n=1 Tax=Variovorax boronicumulans TaxID=436515 RepID=UPI0027830A62|nr:hypothetical protein [Variovorax boronicumulans]MDQ0082938.1 hypothetical protein [Variovorax boronicumulans]